MEDPSDTELAARYRPVLEGEQLALTAQTEQSAGSRQVVELDQQAVGRLSRMDALQGQAMAAALDARRHGRVRAIAAALSRMDAADFGWCNCIGQIDGAQGVQ